MVDMSEKSAATQAMRDGITAGAATPVVFDYVRAAGPDGIRFDVWHGNQHLPALAAAFRPRRLRRYGVPARAGYLAVAELDAAPGSMPMPGAFPASVAHHERFIGEPLATLRRKDAGADVLDAAIVYPAFLRPPADRMETLGTWYDQEHLPILLSCPQWLMTRRFAIRQAHGLDWTHVALHYLSDLRALQSPARDAARATPWRDELLAEGWFAPEYRVCYRLQDFPG